jgi:hypothetical protein
MINVVRCGRAHSRKGNAVINELAPDHQAGVESELVDLSSVSMTALRASNDQLIHTAVRQVVEQVAHVLPTVSNGSSRID